MQRTDSQSSLQISFYYVTYSRRTMEGKFLQTNCKWQSSLRTKQLDRASGSVLNSTCRRRERRMRVIVISRLIASESQKSYKAKASWYLLGMLLRNASGSPSAKRKKIAERFANVGHCGEITIVQVHSPFPGEVRTPSPYVYTHAATQARVCPRTARWSAAATSAGGAPSECTTRRLSRPPPFATDGSSPFSISPERRRGVHLCPSVYPLPRARVSAPRAKPIEGHFEVCVYRYVRRRESQRVNRRGCVPTRLAVHSDRPFPTSASYHASLPSLRSPPIVKKRSTSEAEFKQHCN